MGEEKCFARVRPHVALIDTRLGCSLFCPAPGLLKHALSALCIGLAAEIAEETNVFSQRSRAPCGEEVKDNRRQKKKRAGDRSRRGAQGGGEKRFLLRN